MKKIILLFFICIIIATLILAWFAEDEDFAPYESYTKSLDINISGSTISQIKKQLDTVVNEYEKDMYLSEVLWKFIDNSENDKLTGELTFTYVKTHEAQNKITKIILEYNIDEGKLYELDYEQGHGKRVVAITDPIDDTYISLDYNELCLLFSSNEDYIEASERFTPKIKMEFTRAIWEVRLYDDTREHSPVLIKSTGKD